MRLIVINRELTHDNHVINRDYIFNRLTALIYIQVHLNKLECREKVETFIYFRFIACKVKHFKSFFVLILMIRPYSS